MNLAYVTLRVKQDLICLLVLLYTEVQSLDSIVESPFTGGGSDTCLGAEAPDGTSIPLCTDQTLETDRDRC